MAAFLIFLFFSAFHSVLAQERQFNISTGSSLNPTRNSSWLSRSGLYAFGFYQQANGYAVGVFIAGIPDKTVVWTANRDNPFVPSNSTLSLTTDGRLLVQGVRGQDVYVANPPESIAAASMLDSGNFVLYNSDHKIIWQSFENPTDTLLAGQRLRTQLISSASETNNSRPIFGLFMQPDGNLVQYPAAAIKIQTAYWASNTAGSGNTVSLNLDDDGLLYLYNSTTIILNFTRGGYPTQRTIYRLKIDVDGFFRLYSYSLDRGNWSTLWQPSIGRCDPTGLCGFNSFCTQQDTEVDCKCLPGFKFVIQGNWTLGCARNITRSCEYQKENVSFRQLESTVWENDPYEESNAVTKEDCENACRDDCNCEVAFFNNGNCRKQRLPLRFGRKRLSDPTIALVKMAIPASITPRNPSNDQKITKKELRVDILIISISVLGVAVLIMTISGFLIYRNRVRVYKRISENRNVELMDDVATRTFSYAELKEATSDFKEELGRGAFGTVYKGVLPDNKKVVAVKKLEKILAEGEREFKNEIRVIGKTHHRNLVRLLGYCLDGPQRLLVYEYMSSGSLEKILFSPEKWPNWEERIGIASDVGRGILYLHEECETQIIHCDIKPQNVLLDGRWCAKISDFGLAKLLKHDQTRTYTGIRGTKGYVAPEWHKRLPVTVKADVYSFGVLLLEIACRRKSVDWSRPEHEAILDEWAYTCFEAGELNKLVEDEEVDKKNFERMIKLGIWCTQDEPSLRPSMRKVLLMLEGTVEIPSPPSPTSYLSAI